MAGIRDKLVAIVGEEGVLEFEALVRAEAKKGAEESIPEIRRQVREEAGDSIRPFVIGGIALALASIGLGVVGLFVRPKPAPAPGPVMNPAFAFAALDAPESYYEESTPKRQPKRRAPHRRRR